MHQKRSTDMSKPQSAQTVAPTSPITGRDGFDAQAALVASAIPGCCDVDRESTTVEDKSGHGGSGLSGHQVLARFEERLDQHRSRVITCSMLRSWLSDIRQELEPPAVIQHQPGPDRAQLFACSGSFSLFDRCPQIISCILEHLPHDETICASLICEAFRDSIYGLYPTHRPPTPAAALSSLERYLWIRSFPGEFRLPWWDVTLCALIGEFGDLELLRWARGEGCVWNGAVCTGAAKRGDLEMLQWADSQGCAWGETVLVAAAGAGHLELLEWAVYELATHLVGSDPDFATSWASCPHYAANVRGTDRICGAAAAEGHMEVIQWALDHGCRSDEDVTEEAAAGGHLSVLKWLIDNGKLWGTRSLPRAAGALSIEGLQWMKENGCAPQLALDGELLCSTAAARGRLDVLHWAAENRCKWDATACAAAAAGGHLQVLQWLRAHGCEWDATAASEAAAGGHLELLQWAMENGCEWDQETCSSAAACGAVEVLQWAAANGCPWDATAVPLKAAAGGHLILLQWAMKNGCEWDGEVLVCAAAAGHLKVLQWAMKNGCGTDGTWDEEVCAAAAGNGHFHVLQWARASGINWFLDTCTAAAAGGHLRVLKWARENGCACNDGVKRAAASNGYHEIAEWATRNGCESNPHESHWMDLARSFVDSGEDEE